MGGSRNVVTIKDGAIYVNSMEAAKEFLNIIAVRMSEAAGAVEISCDSCGYDTKMVARPTSVSASVPVVAASMATKQIAEQLCQRPFHSLGQAGRELQKILSPSLLKDIRCTRTARNEAVHGF